MTTWEWIATSVIPALASGGGVWSWMKTREAARARIRRDGMAFDGHRDDNSLVRETLAIKTLTDRVAAMEAEMKTLRHDAHIARRTSHDMSGIAHAARMVLITKFIEVNQVLVEHGKPERYPDPVQEAMDAINKISDTMVVERQQVYDRAERLEAESQLQQTVTEVKKETMVQQAKQESK